MTAIEKYMEGYISLNELIYNLYTINPDIAWIKDVLSSVLNDTNYNHALTIINKGI